MSGIYTILNKVTGEFYIGSTMSTFKQRWSTHKSTLKKNRKDCPRLQNAWNKYGEDAFLFEEIIELETSEPVLRLIETMYIRMLKPEYNILTNATVNPMYGKHHTEEAKVKLSKSHSGENSIWWGVSRKGKDAPFYGMKHKPESNLKRSKKLRGELNPMSKLTVDDILEIRELAPQKEYTNGRLGEMFGVHGDTISAIVNRRAWKHID